MYEIIKKLARCHENLMSSMNFHESQENLSKLEKMIMKMINKL